MAQFLAVQGNWLSLAEKGECGRSWLRRTRHTQPLLAKRTAILNKTLFWPGSVCLQAKISHFQSFTNFFQIVPKIGAEAQTLVGILGFSSLISEEKILTNQLVRKVSSGSDRAH